MRRHPQRRAYHLTMKNYSHYRRVILLMTACSLTWPLIPSSLGQAASAPAVTDPAQAPQSARTPKPAEPEKKIPVEKVPESDVLDEDTVVLSPFEVTTTNKGYYAANSMSGTRMNSKIEDLGQSITVMTKEQMTDFAMRDINDVFDYMASTEGTNTYSQFVTDRTGAVVDNVSLNPTTANRVRGIGNANIAFNNIAMTGRVPVDSLWMEALELSRGPNANIFGLGNASGTVNQVPATANLTRDFTRLEMRGDSYGGWYSSLDVNRKLFKNKLAVRASYKNEHIGFVRKPAGENARRLSFQVKAQPFKNTTVAVSYFSYKANSVRPNYTTPRDYYSDWVSAGKPGWNPATRLITFDDGRTYGNGNVLGSTTPYSGTPSTNALLTLPSWAADGRSMFLIGAPGEAPYWTAPRYTSNPGTPANNFYSTTDPYASGVTGIGLLEVNPAQTYSATIQPLFNTVARPIRDKSIYDYSKINLAGNSKSWDDDQILMAQFDQIILNTPKQTLAFQATYLREDSQRMENQPFGVASVNSNQGQLMVDVNRANLDGTPNPYFGRPFLKTSEPFLRDRPMFWNTGRGQMAYRIDFSHDEGWSKWLGTQQVVGYYEYKDQENRIFTYRHSAMGLDKDWMQKYAYGRPATSVVNPTTGLTANLPAVTPTPLGNRVQQNVTDPRYGIAPGNLARVAELYYVGSTPGGGIEYAPSYFPEGANVAYVWGPNATGMIRDMSPIGFTPSPDGGGGQNNTQTIVKTMGGVWQSTLFKGRLVGTFGLREDKVYDRNAVLPTLTPDLRQYDRAASEKWLSTWREALGKTKSMSLVARPFRDIKFLQTRATRSGNGFSKFLAEVATSFSPTYNKADNFIPQGPAYDLFLHPLPNQSGKSTDIGFWITALDGRLTVRYTHFDTKQLDLRNGDITTMAQRIARYEGFVSSDAYNLRTQAANWLSGVGTGANPTTVGDAALAAAIQMPLDQYTGLRTITGNNTYATVMDSRSKGDELEINFNPTRNWTVSASVTKTEATNTAAGSAVDDYIAARMPIWTTLEDPRFTYTGTTTIAGVPNANYTFVAPNNPVLTQNVSFSVPITAANPVIPNGAGGHLLWWQIFGTQFNALAGYNATSSAAANYAGNVNAPMSVFREMIGRPLPQIREYSAKFSTKYNLAGITGQKFLKNVSVGGSLRYASKASIGYYGLGYSPDKDLSLAQNTILKLDVNRPIYAPAEIYADVFVSYKTKMFKDKVRANFQFNVKNVGESGNRLVATQAFMDGSRATYRIVDPRQFVLSMSFEL